MEWFFFYELKVKDWQWFDREWCFSVLYPMGCNTGLCIFEILCSSTKLRSICPGVEKRKYIVVTKKRNTSGKSHSKRNCWFISYWLFFSLYSVLTLFSFSAHNGIHPLTLKKCKLIHSSVCISSAVCQCCGGWRALHDPKGLCTELPWSAYTASI